MDILSTLKGEYSRTLILILIPGSISVAPFANILYQLYFTGSNVTGYFVGLCFISAILFGFITQDLGGRIEMLLDLIYCNFNDISTEKFYECFNLYLFNRRFEKHIITHYYRSMLVRLKFEVHTVASVFIMWLGILVNYIESNYKIDVRRTWILVTISLVAIIYLSWEAYTGVKTLHGYREDINKKFQPCYEFKTEECESSL